MSIFPLLCSGDFNLASLLLTKETTRNKQRVKLPMALKKMLTDDDLVKGLWMRSCEKLAKG